MQTKTNQKKQNKTEQNKTKQNKTKQTKPTKPKQNTKPIPKPKQNTSQNRTKKKHKSKTNKTQIQTNQNQNQNTKPKQIADPGAPRIVRAGRCLVHKRRRAPAARAKQKHEPDADVRGVGSLIDKARVPVPARVQVRARAAPARAAKGPAVALGEHVVARGVRPVGLRERQPEAQNVSLRGGRERDAQVVPQHALVPGHPVVLVDVGLEAGEGELNGINK
jgi:hypothetical protein